MKKVLITGSLGYVGSVLAPYLRERGIECTGYDTGFFKDCTLYPPSDPTTVMRDARDLTERDILGFDGVIHLAAISNDPFGNLTPEMVYDPTRVYALNIAKLCKKAGAQFIFASSCSVYGKGGGQLLTEDSPTVPQTPYSLNKLQIEEDLRAIADNDFSPIAFRFATAFGPSPRMRFDIVINMLVGMAYTTGNIILNSDGTAWRPNVHVLDMCEAVYQGLTSSYAEPRLLVLNVGDDKNNLQIIDIAKIIQSNIPGCEIRFLNQNAALDPAGLIKDRKISAGGADTRTYRVSFEKIKKYFPGFQCKRSVGWGVEDMLQKFKEIGLTEAEFKNKNFYRLQKIEDLHTQGLISNDLRWAQRSISP